MPPSTSGPSASPSPATLPPALNIGALDRLLAPLNTDQLLRQVIVDAFPSRTVVTTSFGAESAVLLTLIAKTDPATPVVFLDTGYLFAQTLTYRDELVRHLGLTDVRTITPDPGDLAREDPEGDLHKHDPDRCCRLRKHLPLENALAAFDVWISGRKRFHGGDRASLPRVEIDGRYLKVNPLADWSEAAIARAFTDTGLPRHPLIEHGFTSIGCFPCTEPSGTGGYSRAGRWPGRDKTECGIHAPNGRYNPE
ncbi:MAG: phosphoadenylyl-sulfate reductase [Rhodospirillaceae bacterium]|nr:phosphoadenylyl-sulfate reductase [Magnetovibrio sp.]MAY68653.1 phosphoadenylyl-sulfate reductase [Rhodospirillaceae bacterium]